MNIFLIIFYFASIECNSLLNFKKFFEKNLKEKYEKGGSSMESNLTSTPTFITKTTTLPTIAKTTTLPIITKTNLQMPLQPSDIQTKSTQQNWNSEYNSNDSTLNKISDILFKYLIFPIVFSFCIFVFWLYRSLINKFKKILENILLV